MQIRGMSQDLWFSGALPLRSGLALPSDSGGTRRDRMEWTPAAIAGRASNRRNNRDQTQRVGRRREKQETFSCGALVVHLSLVEAVQPFAGVRYSRRGCFVVPKLSRLTAGGRKRLGSSSASVV
jgi:hypothetical protein